MALSIQRTLYSRRLLKLSSLIIGYALWSRIAPMHTAYTWVTVPLAFYNNTHTCITAPETVQVCLQAHRSVLHCIDKALLAAHIDSKKLSKGAQQYTLTAQDLLLPSCVKLCQYKPQNLVITLT